MKILFSASTLAITMALITPETYASESYNASIFENETTFKTPRGVEVIRLEDTDKKNSASFVMGSRKNNVPDNIRRILSLDGGGIRGLYEIAILAVLEEIILFNNPKARISDYFDVSGGTSTGSILAAGLFYEGSTGTKYSAIDLLKLYARYGYEIFDNHKNTLGGGIGSKYTSTGVDRLLIKHFGADHLYNMVQDENVKPKPVYVVGFDADEQKPAVFSTEILTNPLEAQYAYHKRSLVEAIGVSTAAPVYFPARNIIKGTRSVQMKDGGLVANNPAYLIYQEENSKYNAHYEIYSFGTGITPIETGENNTGFAGVGALVEDVFGAQVSAVVSNCMQEIQNPNSTLTYFVRLQPQLEKGMGEMDDTSDSYVNYAIKKAFDVTKGKAFANMVKQLGLKIPDNLEGVFKGVQYKLHTLSADNYDGLDQLEKDWLVQEIYKLNFSLFEHVNVKGVELKTEKTYEILKAAMVDTQNKQNGAFNKIKSLFISSEADHIVELIPRGIEFHEMSKNLPKLNSAVEISDNLLKNITSEFKVLCDKALTHKELSKYSYEKHNSKYIDIMAQIYWKNKLSSIEGEKNIEYLKSMYNELNEYSLLQSSDKAYFSTYLAQKLYTSRDFTLLDGLKKYIQKEFPDEKLTVQ